MKNKLEVIKGGDKPLKRKKYPKSEFGELLDFESKHSPKKHLEALLTEVDNIQDMVIVYTRKSPSTLVIRASDSIGLWSQIGLLEIAIQQSVEEARGK